MSAQATKLTQGWGLIFRYKGAYNYWMLTATPKFGTYNLVKVENGKVLPGYNSGLAKQESGTIVRVEFQGPNISLFVNNQPVKTISDPSNAGGTKVGMVAAELAGREAQWSQFVVKRQAPTLAPGAPAGPKGGGGKPKPGGSSSTTLLPDETTTTTGKTPAKP